MVESPPKTRPLPLFAWEKHQRAERQRVARVRHMCLRRITLLGIGMTALGLTIARPPLPRLVWNASASAPASFRGHRDEQALERGDMVIAWPPAEARQLAARRHYLPSNVPLVKRVVAVAGDTICDVDRTVTVNGRLVALRRTADAAGRPLPAWQGCIRLAPGMVFLLMTETPDSFDGRYFGPTSARDVIGKATPLWLR